MFCFNSYIVSTIMMTPAGTYLYYYLFSFTILSLTLVLVTFNYAVYSVSNNLKAFQQARPFNGAIEAN